jgi:hypothetical protein
MVRAFKGPETNITNILTALRRVGRELPPGRETGIQARAAIDTCIRIDIDPGPLVNRLTGNHALDGTNIDTTAVTNAQAGDDMGHSTLSFLGRYM